MTSSVTKQQMGFRQRAAGMQQEKHARPREVLSDGVKLC